MGKNEVVMGLREILGSFRAGEIVDHLQVSELMRWQLTDFQHEIEDLYVSKTPVILVCGCGRSGTTLTRVILDSHPQLFSGPESSLFLPVSVDLADLAYKFDVSRDILENFWNITQSRAEFIDSFCSLVLKNNSKLLWVDKTARNVHRLDYVFSHFPNATVIHIVRDPRDVVASLKTHKKRKIVGGVAVPTGYIMPVNLCIDRWKLAVQDALKHRKQKNFIQIRYEDIVLNPEETVYYLCENLGIVYDAQMLNFHLQKGPSRDSIKFPQNIEATKQLYESSVGRYKEVLTASEIKLVENQLADFMEELGYETTAVVKNHFSPFISKDIQGEITFITAQDVDSLISASPLVVKKWVEEVFEIHFHQSFIQPQKTYLRTTENPYDRIIALPAYVKGENVMAGIKWIGSHSKNYIKGFARANSLIILNDTTTNAPSVVIDGSLISTMRTFALSLLALDQFAPCPTSIGIIGMGKLGKMHAHFLGKLYPTVHQINCFSKSGSFDNGGFFPPPPDC
jgi:protein-tyrosine sulfotransferase